jgi:hypothetical protein
MLRWKRISLLGLFALSGCGTERIQLQWPAQIISIDGVSAASLSTLTSQISELNTQLGRDVLSIGNTGKGSPISIAKVNTFSDPSTAPTSQADFAEISLSDLGMRVRAAASNTTIAGRATLTVESCSIQLAAFLFDKPENKDLLSAVLWHELGHCAGLGHLTEVAEVMSPITLPLSRYSKEKLQRFFHDFTQAISP